MSVRAKKLHPALKHGAYGATGLLPGEDRVAFLELHRRLIAKLDPDGPLEDETVATIARLTWRKKNLATFRIAEFARNRYSAIRLEIVPSTTPPSFPSFNMNPNFEPPSPAEVEAGEEAAEAQARKELGDNYKFVEMGDAASVSQMLKDFEVEERLDAIIDRLLKRLWYLQASRSRSPTASPAPLPRISGPQKAA
jgi:hypothetical protein